MSEEAALAGADHTDGQVSGPPPPSVPVVLILHHHHVTDPQSFQPEGKVIGLAQVRAHEIGVGVFGQHPCAGPHSLGGDPHRDVDC